jgi:hypothetical protein
MRNISSFMVIDLISQGSALQKFTQGWSEAAILSLLKAHGILEEFTDTFGNQVFHFLSPIGLNAIFYLRGNRFTFILDNTTYQPK